MVVDRPAGRGRLKQLMRRLCQSHLNRLVVRFSGRPRSPFVILSHVGRKSGNQYRIPVMAYRAGRWFIIGLPYGEDCQWCRNVMAADGCDIQWRGAVYRASGPRVLKLEVVGQRLPRRERTVLGLMGVQRYLMVKASEPLPAAS